MNYGIFFSFKQYNYGGGENCCCAFDGPKDCLITDFTFRFAGIYSINPDWDDHSQFYTKRKQLKTKTKYKVDIFHFIQDKTILPEIEQMLPQKSLFKYLVKRNGYWYREVITEKLPVPIVFYSYIFIGFKYDIDDTNLYFCSCAKPAIKNIIASIDNVPLSQISNEKITKFVGEMIYGIEKYYKVTWMHFPDKKYIGDNCNILFKDNICHICNNIIPDTYFHASGHTRNLFIKKFGWYYDQRLLEYGLSYAVGGIGVFLYEALPDKYRKMLESGNYRPLDIEYEVENELRRLYGYYDVGMDWASERTLYENVKKAFPNVDVIHHGRPKWLGQQHLDIWIPAYKIAIEYQGIQHQKPLAHYGGEEQFLKNKERDERKKRLCEENGTKLFYIYDEKSVHELGKHSATIEEIVAYCNNIKS